MFIIFCENVLMMMTGNTNYVSSFPSLVDVQAALDALKAANLAAQDRSITAIANRNQAREDLLGLMRSLAAWVQAHCQNNLAILLSSGFDANRTRTPVGPSLRRRRRSSNKALTRARSQQGLGRCAAPTPIAGA
ncbi:MAG TPA: hypothetical protein VHW03_01760 [Chthoniobacterales bacterium]|nr:hypothetical protein [Chthoniobacterales bacterium]